MQDSFHSLFASLTSSLHSDEVLLAYFSGEATDFVRVNHARVRQAGHVHQRRLALDLIRGPRHAAATCTLTGGLEADTPRATALLADLRELLPHVPDDPYLLYNTTPQDSTFIRPSTFPDAGALADAFLSAGQGADLVGLLATGLISTGFANSLGQRNWHSAQSFHFDFSLYHAADKAVKTTHAGFEWDPAAFAAKAARAREQLALLAQPPRTIPPGTYRVYLAPTALQEILQTVAWGGFGLKSIRTKTTCLLGMTAEGRTLSPAVTLRENPLGGLTPAFYAGGFLRAPCVTLIDAGKFRDPLVSPRSAREYSATPNGNEWPESLDLLPGTLPAASILEQLGTGVYVNNLWYLNYSDRPACRMTGMTRFATFWVENGRIVAPLNVMRFDETLYHLLGDHLLALTAERELIPSDSTYGQRSTSSIRLPGALTDQFAFTL